MAPGLYHVGATMARTRKNGTSWLTKGVTAGTDVLDFINAPGSFEFFQERELQKANSVLLVIVVVPIIPVVEIIFNKHKKCFQHIFRFTENLR